MPEIVPPDCGFASDNGYPSLSADAEFSGMFTLVRSVLLTTPAAKRMTSGAGHGECSSDRGSLP